ncbi:MAG: DUF4870 domain-containing protein [Patescibacteria group bacterium]|nr:DUF4870 domain-containing protein [Patescibacteria group bacterium]
MPEENKEEVKETTPKSSGGTGLEPNVAAMLAYLFLGIGGLIIYLIEKENKFVRFAAMQSIVLGVAVLALNFLYSIILVPIFFSGIGVGLLFSMVSWLIWLGFVVVWIMLMVKAYQNQEWELPVVGKIARNAVNK